MFGRHGEKQEAVVKKRRKLTEIRTRKPEREGNKP
jgi:hypothetical protein